MTSTTGEKTTGEKVVFYMRATAWVIWIITAIWTAVPLYHRDYADFRARLAVWIIFPIMVAAGWVYNFATDGVRSALQTALCWEPMQRLVEASGIPQEYWEAVLPTLIVTPPLIWLVLRSPKHDLKDRVYSKV